MNYEELTRNIAKAGNDACRAASGACAFRHGPQYVRYSDFGSGAGDASGRVGA